MENHKQPKGISFGKTLAPLLENNKCCTRRVWTERTAKTFIKYFEQGVKVPALDKSFRNGGKIIGWLEIRHTPYQDNLSDITQNDLIAEGFPDYTPQQFIDEFFEGKDQLVWVIWFKFSPLSELNDMINQTASQGIQEVTKDNPCPHCGKPDWCYFLGDLSVCKRGVDPAQGWEKTGKADSDNTPYYAPIKPRKELRQTQQLSWEYPDRQGNPLVRVMRFDKAGQKKKDIWQEFWIDGAYWSPKKYKEATGKELVRPDRATIPIYRYAEVQEAIAQGQTIFITEGEKCADRLWALGIPATTNIGGSGKWRKSDTQDLLHANVAVICPDCDTKGLAHAEAIAENFPEARWLYAFPESPAWKDPPASDGVDVADWIAAYNLKRQDILLAVEDRRQLSDDQKSPIDIDIEENHNPETELDIEHYFTQKAEEALYSEGYYLAVGGNLYRWQGKYYEQLSESVEKRRIKNWLSSYTELVGKQWKCIRANARSVSAVWDWVVTGREVLPDKINPPGLNCENGVLRIEWKLASDGTPEAFWRLDKHSPDDLYLYCSGAIYDPDADPTSCDRLLEALDPAQRKIFLQTIAAALDLETVRKHCGRMVKMLLCWGEGSNGKDALREAVAVIFGQSMTNASVADFNAYDLGRKFSLAKLEGALINWASENTKFVALDSLQSIKQFGTGDPISIERKHKDEYQITPKAVGLFNCNEPPSMMGGLEAVLSRWCVLRFSKVFKRNADPSRSELEADPRFKYDRDFLRLEVAPALLNRLLQELKTLVRDGINYESAKGGMIELQEDSCHLWSFVREYGIEYGDDRLYLKDLWQALRQWYLDTGVLEIESNGNKEKTIWHELPRKSDKPVKAVNQVYARLSDLFPKISKARHTEAINMERMGQWYLSGLKTKKSLQTASDASEEDLESVTASETASEVTTSEAVSEARSLTLRTSEASEAVLAKLFDFFQNLQPLDQRQLLTHLANLQKFKVGDRVQSLINSTLAGTIDRIDEINQCWIQWDDGKFFPLPMAEIAIAAAAPTPQPKFKPGDVAIVATGEKIKIKEIYSKKGIEYIRGEYLDETPVDTRLDLLTKAIHEDPPF